MSSLANYITGSGKLAFQSEVSNTETVGNMQIQNGSNVVNHTVDSSGNYVITNQNNQKLLKFDNNANLIDGALLQGIIANTDEITIVANNLNTLQTSFTALQNSIGGGEGSQNIASVLTVGNDAGGLNLINLDQLSANRIYLDGLGITTNGSKVSIPNVQTGELDVTTIYLNNQNFNTQLSEIQSYITKLKYFFNIFRQSAIIIDPATGSPYNWNNLI
jgi:hypothetical protein